VIKLGMGERNLERAQAQRRNQDENEHDAFHGEIPFFSL
jgi:hypothetical protein